MGRSMTATKTSPRPAAEPSQENALRTLVRAFGLLERVMQPYFARFGISGSQWGMLRALDCAQREGLPNLRLTDLGDRLFIRPPSVSAAVDRLERAGLIARDPSSTDQRTKLIRLTGKGRKLVDRVSTCHPRQVDMALAGLTEIERRQLQHLLDRLAKSLEGCLAGGSRVQEEAIP
jgi:DNA-binding MarR family transcriptional regulator